MLHFFLQKKKLQDRLSRNTGLSFIRQSKQSITFLPQHHSKRPPRITRRYSGRRAVAASTDDVSSQKVFFLHLNLLPIISIIKALLKNFTFSVRLSILAQLFLCIIFYLPVGNFDWIKRALLIECSAIDTASIPVAQYSIIQRMCRILLSFFLNLITK